LSNTLRNRIFDAWIVVFKIDCHVTTSQSMRYNQRNF
jgi:hypothetical protein